MTELIEQICQSITGSANYIILVRTYSYSNPSRQLADGRHCYTIVSSPPFSNRQDSACNSRFHYCLKPLSDTEGSCVHGATSGDNNNDNSIDFSSPTFLGLQNPLPLEGLTSQWQVSETCCHLYKGGLSIYDCQ